MLYVVVTMGVKCLGRIYLISILILSAGWGWAASITFLEKTTGSNSLSLSVGDRVEVQLKLSAGGAKLTGISLFISYDPSFIEVEDADPKTPGLQPVEATSLLNWMIFSNEIKDDVIDFSMATLMKDKSFSGEGVIGVIHLKALRPVGSTVIRLETDAARHMDSRFTFLDQNGEMKTAPFLGMNKLTITVRGLLLKQIGDLTITNDGKIYQISLADFMIDPDSPPPGLKWEVSGNKHVKVDLDLDKHLASLSCEDKWFGVEEITFTAIDPQGNRASTSASVTVKSPPRIKDIPDITFIIGERRYINLNRYVVDYDDPDLKGIKWSFSGAGNVVVNITPDNKAYISPNDGWTGQETLTFTATDADGYSASDSCTITILPDTFPRVLDIPDVIAKSDGSYMSVRIDLDDYVVDSDTPPDKIEWSCVGNVNVLVNIDPITHEVTFSSLNGWVGKEKVTFRATDPEGHSASDDCTVEIIPNSLPPVLSDMPDVSFSLKVGHAELDLNKYVSDMDTSSDKIRWSFHGNSIITVEITPQNVARFTATKEASERITFTATDPDGNSAEKTITVTAYRPKPPTISDLPEQKLKQGDVLVAFDLDDYVSDDQTPPQKIKWHAEGYDPSHLVVSIGEDHLLTLTASSNWFGTEEIKLVATDGDGNSSSKTLKVRVITPPVVKPIPPLSLVEGQTDVSLDLDDYVSDPDTPLDEISWRASGYKNLIVVIDSNNHKVMIHAPEGVTGTENITFTATDPDGNSDETELSVTISPKQVGKPPILSGFSDISIPKGGSDSSIDLDEHVTDPDGLPELISWQVKGAKMLKVDVNPDTHIVTISPLNPDWTGEEIITFVATDPDGNSAEAKVKVRVYDPNAALPPKISQLPEVNLKQGESMEIDLRKYISDEDTPFDSLKLSVKGNSKVYVNLNETGILTLTAPSDWSGGENLTIEAVDPDGNTASAEMKVNVTGGSSGNNSQPLSLKVFVTPNPVNPNLLRITVIPSNNLISSPSVEPNLEDGIKVKMERISDRIWSGVLILPQKASGRVKISVSAKDVNGNIKTDEVEIDLDKLISVRGDSSSGGKIIPSLDVFPNPVSGDSVKIIAVVPGFAAYRFSVKVFTLSGKLIASLESERFNTTENGHEAVWDLRDRSGEKVANGVYILTLDGIGKVISRKLAVRR